MRDFEDAVQANAAKQNNIGIVVTRNISDFENSDLLIFTPAGFLNWLNEQ